MARKKVLPKKKPKPRPRPQPQPQPKLEAAAKLPKFNKKAEALPPVPPPWSFNPGPLALSRLEKRGVAVNPFFVSEPPPNVLPKGKTAASIAMDSGVAFETSAWAAQAVYNGAFFNGLAFMGYTYLAELAQRPEYRHITETLATEMTRKWIRLKVTNQDQAKQKATRIKQLNDRMEQLNVQGAFRREVELDGFFGRGHLYIDTGDGDNPEELKTSIGDGSDAMTMLKFKGRKNFIRAIKPIEPIWCYPATYNANDPLSPNWYNPQTWFCQGKETHASRLMPFVGREVPDMLKPSYMFGGLSLSQMAKPYVDNWLRTRQSVADLIWSFSVMVLSTDLGTLFAEDGQKLYDRVELFNNFRTNQGTFLIDKNTEEFSNVSVQLGTLDKLQAQSQEQMCSVSGTPVVKLLGVQPSGLNASSEGELTTWADRVAAFQEKFFHFPLKKVINLIQLDLWGEIDPDITFEFLPIEELSEPEQATTDKTEMDTDVAAVGAGILDPVEVRKRLALEGAEPVSGTPEQYAADLDKEVTLWAKVVKESGAKAD